MLNRLFSCVALVSLLLTITVGQIFAAEDGGDRRPPGPPPDKGGRPDGDKGHRPPPGGNPMVRMILQHAAELNLTDEQKAKLEEMGKGPMALLTDEQKKKLKEFMPPPRPGGPRGEGDGPKEHREPKHENGGEAKEEKEGGN